MADENYYPPVGLYFKVTVDGIDGLNEGDFQEVTGLNAKIGVESVQEGGENRFEHRLPTPLKYENLVLKRGMVTSSPLIQWAMLAVEQFKFTPKTVTITLMNEGFTPIAVWLVNNAYPVALQVSGLKAQDNTNVVMEQLELAYDNFNRTQ